MDRKRFVKTFVFLLTLVISFSLLMPLNLIAASSDFDFWVIAGKDSELCSYWLNLVEHNDEWYISADDACFFSGFENWKKTDKGIRYSRKPFYEDLDVPFNKTTLSVDVSADSTLYKGKFYYRFNTVMDNLRTKVSYSETSHLVVFETCKVFPVEFNIFCERLVKNNRYFMDDEDSSAAWTAISVNFLADLMSARKFFTGHDTDETTVLKNIIKTPAFTDPNMKDYFHAKEKHEDAFSFINKLCGYYVDVKSSDWGKGNTIFSYYIYCYYNIFLFKFLVKF